MYTYTRRDKKNQAKQKNVETSGDSVETLCFGFQLASRTGSNRSLERHVYTLTPTQSFHDDD